MTKRIFWFGMHKVLRKTELAQLRALGFEVFSPAYLSPIYDQSADLTVDHDQPTTLPKDVFDKLIGYNFFYNEISEEISDVLNDHFDAAIVTISALWLKSFLSAYRGPVIYRMYGQHFPLAGQVVDLDFWETLISRDDITVVPFAAETLEREDEWFTALCHEAVPYQLPDDIFAHSGTWRDTAHRPVVTTHIPNIENPYYAAAYAAFRAQYPHRSFEITGPQRTHPPDASILGGRPRGEFIERLKSSSGFLYNYADDVCYLTPIEMMEIGGPVLYAPGSLLARFFGGPTPGLVPHPSLAGPKLAGLLRGDRVLIDEMISAQEHVRRRYDRALVRPLFEEAFRRLLGDPHRPSPFVVEDHVVRGAQRREDGGQPPTLVAFLHDDALLGRDRGALQAGEPSTRMLVQVARAAAAIPDGPTVLVTCLDRSKAAALDLFDEDVRRGRVEICVLPDTAAAAPPLAEQLARLDLIAKLNARPGPTAVVVPHQSLFPETLLFKGKRIVCVPGYQPTSDRLYTDPGDRAADEERENAVCRLLREANLILASSEYTAECLEGSAAGREIADRVAVLAPSRALAEPAVAAGSERGAALAELEGRRFLFYPHVNRPDTGYRFLMTAFAAARMNWPDLMLVVTDQLGRIPGVGEIADAHDLKPHILTLDGPAPSDMRWLYDHAAALAYVSSFEGSLPTPMVDAIRHGLPVIATRLPVLDESLGQASERLLRFASGDVEQFTAALRRALDDKSGIAGWQRAALDASRLRQDAGSGLAALLSRHGILAN